MADEHVNDADFPRDTDADVDPAVLAEIEQLLGGLDFLRPDAIAPEPIPDAVWARLTDALAAERANPGRETDVHPLAARRGPSGATRWAGGLVAASIAVVAVGVGVTALRGTPADVAVVAGDAPLNSAAAESKAFAAPESGAEADVLRGPQSQSYAGIASILTDSDTAYTSSGLRSQVRSVLSAFGIGDKQQAESKMSAPPTVDLAETPSSGFMATEQSLRDCIDQLTKDAEAMALMVDNATYEGQDAGVVVTPTEPPASSQPNLGVLQVWVVDEDCEIIAKGVTLRMLP